MPSANVDRTPQYEYRHKYTVLPRHAGLAGSANDRDAAFVDDLIESIGNLDRGEGEDWQLVRIKVYEDTAGRRWVHAYLKRQRVSADESSDLESPDLDSPDLDRGEERSLPRAA